METQLAWQSEHGISKRMSSSGILTGLPMSDQSSAAGRSQTAVPVRELNQ